MEISIVSLKGGSYLVGWGKKTYYANAHPKKPSWYAPDFFLENKTPWHTHEHTQVLPSLSYSRRPMTAGKPASFKDMYNDMKLIKGVVYTSLPLYNFDWQSALTFLLERGKNYYVYGTEGILGATPELLFDLSEGKVETMALASTSEIPETLLEPKEQEEHSIVVKGIYESLSNFGSVSKQLTELASFGSLYHLRTKITLNASPSFDVLVAALHPTPALGTWPKKEGTEWLKKWNEKVPRHRYGAPFGYSFPEMGETRVFVAIRCVQWDDQGAALWAGVGVTHQSVYENEWLEVLSKFQNIANLFGLEL